ncbi:unnamed protein product [Pleuronectes platessa]|uniref:Uncharacterized protein n=1 Tax=Pleuronectes platessa TaxID=8262 RepID=A0A9N7V514_PLEPL|nr:unnamed protein product [Pleuronectes platessa]
MAGDIIFCSERFHPDQTIVIRRARTQPDILACVLFSDMHSTLDILLKLPACAPPLPASAAASGSTTGATCSSQTSPVCTYIVHRKVRSPAQGYKGPKPAHHNIPLECCQPGAGEIHLRNAGDFGRDQSGGRTGLWGHNDIRIKTKSHLQFIDSFSVSPVSMHVKGGFTGKSAAQMANNGTQRCKGPKPMHHNIPAE